MAKRYSIYEAKAHFSELLRRVKNGAEVTVTERGTPIAKVIPFAAQESFEERLQALSRSGQIIPRSKRGFHFSGRAVAGALKRFLDERE